MKQKTKTSKTRNEKSFANFEKSNPKVVTFMQDKEKKIMKLKFIPPPKVTPTFVANVHSTGKIGFTIAGAKHFGISTSKIVQLAVNEDDVNDDSIYGILVDNQEGVEGYKVMKGGEYHSVVAKGFFDTIKLDYTTKPVSYVVTDVEVQGTKVMKFSRRNVNEPNGQK